MGRRFPLLPPGTGGGMRLRGVAFLLALLAAAASPLDSRGEGIPPPREGAPDPRNASYRIDGRTVRLSDGRSETEAAPGSATREITALFGEPVFGSLREGSFRDAALILAHDPGGSGTFYYAAAAILSGDGYRGTDAILLGDRISPQGIEIRNHVVIVHYADRRPGEPMSARPSVGRSAYLTLEQGRLSATPPLEEGEQVLEGWVTIGHEVRSFSPCAPEGELWLRGDSPSIREIAEGYRRILSDPVPYTPLFMTLAGRFAPPPAEGFGADYGRAFLATRLIRVSPRGNCRGDRIVVESPAPGAVVSSPLRVRGHARGTWFFEGDFPLLLQDATGKTLARKYATATGEWMTREFVPFEGTLEFDPPPGGRGTLILRKNNPTDDPSRDDRVELPVLFRDPRSLPGKIGFDPARLDDDGLYGPPDGRRAMHYEFCIPAGEPYESEVRGIDPSVQRFGESPGRIGCGNGERLCLGSTHQPGFRGILARLAELAYIRRIEPAWFE